VRSKGSPASRVEPQKPSGLGGPPIAPGPEDTAAHWTCGRIRFNRRKINLSQVLAGQKLGIKQVDERIWLATFMQYDLGYFDDATRRLEPLQNPFGPKVLPMPPV
jgi:putative transposase